MRFVSFILNQYKIISAILIIALLIQFIFGKPRWQFYPIYLLVLLYFLFVMINNIYSISIVLRNIVIFVSVFLIFLSALSLFALPMESLPNPTGEYDVGTKDYDIIDKNRKSVYSDVLNENRKIKVQIFYPAKNTEKYKKAKWIIDGKTLTRALAKNMNLPGFALDHTTLIESNSFEDAPISDERESYPIVVISHGWVGFRELHTDFAEELASNGYVAISIDHTYGSQAVKFNNGNIAYLKPQILPNREDTDKFLEYANKLVATYGRDVISVIDNLGSLNDDITFENRLDTSKIGVMGHSTGGGGDVYASLEDDRIDALFALDAWTESIEYDKLEKGLEVPSLFLRSNEWENIGYNNESLFKVVNNSNKARIYQIDDTTHFDFSMAYMYSPLTKYIGLTGKLNGRKSAEIQRKFMVSFFDENLKGKASIDIEDMVRKYEFVRNIKE